MLDLLRDSAVGTMIGLIGALAAIIAIVVTRRTKRLTYQITATFPLVRAHSDLARHLRVSFDDQPVPNAYVTFVRLENTGSEAIKPSDYERNIVIGVVTPTQVIAAMQSDEEETAIDAVITTETQRAIIAPLLLNSGDHLTIALLTSGPPLQIVVDWRIAGVKNISAKRGPRWILLPSLLYFLGGPASLFFLGLLSGLAGTPVALGVGALAALGWLTWSAWLLRNARSKASGRPSP